MRPERRYGEWHRRRRPAGILSIQPSYWQVFALAMAIPSSSRLYSPRLSISGNTAWAAGHCLIFFGAQLRPLAFAGKRND